PHPGPLPPQGRGCFFLAHGFTVIVPITRRLTRFPNGCSWCEGPSCVPTIATDNRSSKNRYPARAFKTTNAGSGFCTLTIRVGSVGSGSRSTQVEPVVTDASTSRSTFTGVRYEIPANTLNP